MAAKIKKETEGPYTIWTIEDMAAQFKVSAETIRRKVLNGELPEPNLGDIPGRGAKRWVARGVIRFLLKQGKDRQEPQS